MDTNESSRTIDVIYTYEVADHGTMVFEYENDELVDGWHMSILRPPPSIFSFMGIDDSFHRIREWALQNHPELFL